MELPINYRIEYVVLNIEGRVVKDGEIIVKHKTNKFEAQCSLEVFLKKKYVSFNSMIVKKCDIDNKFASLFNNIFDKNNSKSPFGGSTSNPFKF